MGALTNVMTKSCCGDKDNIKHDAKIFEFDGFNGIEVNY